MPEVLTFDEALAVPGSTNRILLVGNGFSRACRNNLFAYDRLMQLADFATMSFDAGLGFEALGTSDFEALMRALRSAAAILQVYDGADDIRLQLEADAEALKEILVNAIARSHPDHPFEIEDDEYRACRVFLSHFERTYTLNYDLLLYWTAMRSDLDDIDLRFDDGFRAPEDDPDSPYVTWEPSNTRGQTVFYLHGGLHLFDGGAEIQKYTWSRTGERLIDQVRSAMDQGLFPVFVSEGESSGKLSRVRHHAYLSRGERSIITIRNDVFVFGFAMSDNDAHVLRWLEQGGSSRLFVSLFGDPESDENRRIVDRTEAIRQAKRHPEDVEIYFFDAASARVWG